jgi:Ser/Thr protein kinase RdoA (MazF antagonist)
VSPQLTLCAAADVLERHWALSGRLTELGSFEDQSFAVADDTGDPGYVLKVKGPERSVSLELEHEILHRLAETAPPCDRPAESGRSAPPRRVAGPLPGSVAARRRRRRGPAPT